MMEFMKNFKDSLHFTEEEMATFARDLGAKIIAPSEHSGMMTPDQYLRLQCFKAICPTGCRPGESIFYITDARTLHKWLTEPLQNRS